MSLNSNSYAFITSIVILVTMVLSLFSIAFILVSGFFWAIEQVSEDE